MVLYFFDSTQLGSLMTHEQEVASVKNKGWDGVRVSRPNPFGQHVAQVYPTFSKKQLLSSSWCLDHSQSAIFTF